MTTDYDPIAEQYKRSKQQPWRAFIEAFTMMQLIGDPTGKAVVDIACGEGFYTRLLPQLGARRVTVAVGPLSPEKVRCALDAGTARARHMIEQGLIHAAALWLQGTARGVGCESRALAAGVS